MDFVPWVIEGQRFSVVLGGVGVSCGSELTLLAPDFDGSLPGQFVSSTVLPFSLSLDVGVVMTYSFGSFSIDGVFVLGIHRVVKFPREVVPIGRDRQLGHKPPTRHFVHQKESIHTMAYVDK